MTIATYDPLHIAFIKAVERANGKIPSVPSSGAALNDFLISEGFIDRLTKALVELKKYQGSIDECDALDIAFRMQPRNQR